MNKILGIVALVFLCSAANAATISTETKSILITKLGQLDFQCTPGVAPNGHNYPTSSTLEFNFLAGLLPDSNVGTVYVMNDFSPASQELGDHCTELTNEFTNMLPATLTLTRTLNSTLYWDGRNCLNELVESVTGKLAKLELDSDTKIFVTGTAEQSACANAGLIH